MSVARKPTLSLDADYVVVGAGMAGLRAADCLSAKGHAVVVIEKERGVGGLAWSPPVGRKGNRVRLNAGPSEHMPAHDALRTLIAKAKADPSILDRDEREMLEEYTSPTAQLPLAIQQEAGQLASVINVQAAPKWVRVEDALGNNRFSSVPWLDEARKFLVADAAQYVADTGKALTIQSYGTLAKYMRKRCERQGVRFQTDALVTEIRNQTFSKHVEVVAAHKGKKQALFARAVVVCVPLHDIASIDMTACDEDVQRRAHTLINASSSVFSTRIHFVYEEPQPWLERVAGTERAHIWDAQRSFRWAIALSPRVLLASYTDDLQAVRIAHEFRDNKAALVKRLLEGINAHIDTPLREPQYVHAGGAHGGAAFHVRVDPDADIPATAAPVSNGGVVFAGEGVAIPCMRGWIEGALMSAERASKTLAWSGVRV